MTTTWPIPGIGYGGDYNPEQWPRATWDDDVTLMRQAGINLVSVGMWAWALIETDEGVFDFSWLDDLLDLLHRNGIAVDLGTPTAAPPAWFFAKYPESRVVTRDGVALGFGSRGMVSPSSPAYREAIVRIASALAERYAHHPAVVMWHVHNEYGAPVSECYSHASVLAFRTWLREKYQSLDALNHAWGTTVWGQHYTSWEHIGAPAAAPSVVNPSQRLDFARFSDHQLRQCFIAERDAIRAHAAQPITTNFMANQHWGVNLWEWAREVDIVSDDHYLVAADPEAEIGLAIAADLTRSLAGGRPWIMLEHSTSGVNWQERNVAKRPGEMARNSMAHLARGADAICFFQVRGARWGQEKFHSAMIPHAGRDTRIFREVVALGETLGQLGDVRGSTVHAEVAFLWDFESMWAQDLEWRPSVDLGHKERMRAWYEPFWRRNITVDFVHPSHDLTGYRLVVAPAQYLLSKADAANLDAFVARGGTLLASCFTAAVDDNDAVHEGGYLAPLSETFGIRVHEYLPLRQGDALRVALEGTHYGADVWAEDIEPLSAQTVATYIDGPVPGAPAITRNTRGEGVAWYVSTRLGTEGITTVVEQAVTDAGVSAPVTPPGVELVTRTGDNGSFAVAINHRDTPAELQLHGTDMITNLPIPTPLRIDGGAIVVVRLTPEHPSLSTPTESFMERTN
ncbi:MAG: beta-galactosidase [Propionibacteriaceae bacterium]|nr:beta-galactosidase [Propionibacteriaceae bacterium]